MGRCPYAHITIERSLRHLCLGIYCVAQGMGDGITTFVSYSPKVHCTASIPRDSPGFDVARWILGRLFLQLLPLVSNKHPISLVRDDVTCLPRQCHSLYRFTVFQLKDVSIEIQYKPMFSLSLLSRARSSQYLSQYLSAYRNKPHGLRLWPRPRSC